MTLFGCVDQRAGDRGLDALALREAFGAAVDELAHFERGDRGVGALADRGVVEPVQMAEVGDVFARAHALVQAARIRQRAEPAAHGDRVGGGVDAVDEHLAAIGLHQCVQTAQRRRLAGAVGSEQAGDFAVARAERHAVDGDDLAERLVQIAYFYHG